MGALFSSLAALFTSHREYKLIIVGLDNAGKTTALSSPTMMSLYLSLIHI